MADKAVLARFDQERQALALMDHPNIARVLDGRIASQGDPHPRSPGTSPRQWQVTLVFAKMYGWSRRQPEVGHHG